MIARGICLHGGGMVLHYEFAPGITRDEPRGSLLFDVEYDTDIQVQYTGTTTGAIEPLKAAPLLRCANLQA